MALEPARLTDFKLLGPLGSGATSRVVDAVHAASGRRVAIKLLEAPEDEVASELRERFAREALVLAGLNSRHVGRILGFGFEKGQPFLVLEHLEGETIDDRLKREGPIPLGTLIPWVAQIIVGLRDIHAVGVVHRDLKPANIFLQRTAGDPVVKLIDFGLARGRVSHGSLTSTQHVLGSVGYMSPEQFADAKTVGPSADIYAMGCAIFRCLTGRLPFMSKSLDAVVHMKTELDPPALSSMGGAPRIAELDWFVARAMARRSSDRFPTARDMLDAWWNITPALEEALRPAGLTEPPRHPSDSIPVEFDDMRSAPPDATLQGDATPLAPQSALPMSAPPGSEINGDDVDSGWGEPKASLRPPDAAERSSPSTEPFHTFHDRDHTSRRRPFDELGMTADAVFGVINDVPFDAPAATEPPSHLEARGAAFDTEPPTLRNIDLLERLVREEREVAKKRRG